MFLEVSVVSLPLLSRFFPLIFAFRSLWYVCVLLFLFMYIFLLIFFWLFCVLVTAQAFLELRGMGAPV